MSNIRPHLAGAKLLGMFLVCLTLVAQSQERSYRNPIGMEFILVDTGSVLIGKYQPTVGTYQPPSADNQSRKVLPPSAYKVAGKLAEDAAMPGFRITITKSFYLGKYEVTQAQWQKVMGNNPSYFKSAEAGGSATDHPVENVSWQDARTFINRLNGMDRNYTYRLPTEFEWEYAAGAGASDDILWSDAAAMGVVSTASTNRVGSKEANSWGFYDMIGNVWEWVEDYYNGKIFADPVVPLTGKQHVLKGAAFTGDAKNATYKTHAAGPANGFDVGLRVVMESRQALSEK